MALAPPQSDFERTGKLQRKIDVSYKAPGGWRYHSSTNWWRTCRDAKLSVCDKYGFALSDLRASFDKD